MRYFDKNRILYAIKHNEFLKSAIIKLGGAFFRCIGLFVKPDDNLFLFVANGGNGASGSPYEIYKYIRETRPNATYRYIWGLKDVDSFDETETVKFDSLHYYITALKAAYWVTDNNIDRGMRFKKKNTKYLNTWHGVALKKIGNDDPNSGHYDYSYLDYICVSGEHDKKVYTTALNVSESAFLECGMPRNDRLINVDLTTVI